MGKECKISGRPFTSFRWQGQHKRWKETCISPEVAREKNVCQSCVNDLEYGVPFHVRDQVMAALGKEGAVSDVNKEFWWHNKKQEQEDDGGAAGGGLSTYDQLRDSVEQLREFAALDPGPVLRPRRDTPLTPEEQERLRQRRLAELRPPEDKSISSLFVGSIPPGAQQPPPPTSTLPAAAGQPRHLAQRWVRPQLRRRRSPPPPPPHPSTGPRSGRGPHPAPLAQCERAACCPCPRHRRLGPRPAPLLPRVRPRQEDHPRHGHDAQPAPRAGASHNHKGPARNRRR